MSIERQEGAYSIHHACGESGFDVLRIDNGINWYPKDIRILTRVLRYQEEGLYHLGFCLSFALGNLIADTCKYNNTKPKATSNCFPYILYL